MLQTPRVKRLAVCASVGLLSSLCVSAAASQALSGPPGEPAPLFATSAGPARPGRAHTVAPKRSRPVHPQVAHLADGLDRVEQRVLLNLFDDVQIVARRSGLDRLESSAFVWRGAIEDPLDQDESGEVTLVVRNGIVVGTVFLPGRTFEIGYTGSGEHEIVELDPAAFPTDDPQLDALALQPDLLTPSGMSITAAAAADASTQIDVMVLWTPAARVAAGGASAIQSLVNLAVANTNTAYTNSRVNTQIRLVYSGEIAYTETTSDIGTDLQRLQAPGDGYLDAVQTLRNTYSADMVSLVGTGYTTACGIGYVMSPPGAWFESAAFSVIERSCAAGNMTLAHELGHNQGMAHDPPNAPLGGAYSYSYGYVDPGGAFRTIMAYGGAPRITHFSSPTITYSGRPTGASAQDNARTLNDTASAVANFRQGSATACTYVVSPTTQSFGAGGGSAMLAITATAGCGWSLSNTLGWVSSSAIAGTGSAWVTVTAAANTGASRSGTIAVAGQSVSVSQAAAACTYMVSPTSTSFQSVGGTASMSISTASTCTWAVGNTTGWVTAGAVSGTGPATVTLTATPNTGALRSGTLTIAGQTVTVSQSGACTYTVSPTSSSFPSGGGATSISISAGSTCTWAISNTTGWVTTSATSGTGAATVLLTAAVNTGASRSGSLTIAGQPVNVSQPSGCTYTVTPTAASFPSGGGATSISISAAGTCTWAISNSTGWVTTSATSGTGAATVLLTAAVNAGASRSGSLIIAGQPVNVSQPSGCTYTVTPTAASFPSGGGATSISISAAGTCTWAISNSTGWVTTSATSGTGAATVMLTAAANTGASRNGSLTIAGQPVNVSQPSGCTYTVTPTAASFPSAGGATSISISAASTCTWAISNTTGWVTTSATSGTGAATVLLTAAVNTGASRSGSLMIAGQPVNVSQSSGCTYTVSPTAASFPSGGGTASISISAGSTCTWAISNSTGWVTTSATSGTGAATVMLTAAPNTGASRNGSLTVAGLTIIMTQPTGCSYTVSPTSLSFPNTGGNATVTVSSAATCTWTLVNTTGWVTATPTSWTGPSTVSLTVGSNTGTSRSGSLTVAGRTVTVSQSAGSGVSRGKKKTESGADAGGK